MYFELHVNDLIKQYVSSRALDLKDLLFYSFLQFVNWRNFDSNFKHV